MISFIKTIKEKNKVLSKGVKASFIYVLANIITRALSIITLPIFTRIISTEQIGVVNLYHSWYLIISEIAVLALTSGGLNLSLKHFSNERAQYCSSLTFLTTLTAMAMIISYIISPELWTRMTGLSNGLIIMIFIGLIVNPAFHFWLAKNRYEYKYKIVGMVTVLEAIVASGIAVIAVIVAKNSGYSNLGEIRLYANNFIQYGLSLIIYIMIFLKGKTFFNLEYWRFSLSLSIPLIIHQFASEILSVSDRTMIGRFIGNSEVGIYSTIYTLSSISLIVWTGINTAYVPYLYDNLDNEDKKEEIKKITYGIICIFGIVVLLIVLFSPDIIRILTTSDYFAAIDLVPPIACGVFLIAVSNLYSNILIYYHKTRYIVIATIIAAVVNLILNYIGLRAHGYKVAAYTTMTSYIIMVFIEEKIVCKVHKNVTGKPFVFNKSVLHLLEFFVIGLSMTCLFLYKLDILRYLFIVVLVVLCVLFRNRLGRLIKEALNRKTEQ